MYHIREEMKERGEEEERAQWGGDNLSLKNEQILTRQMCHSQTHSREKIKKSRE
jgi:hypothetical protein